MRCSTFGIVLCVCAATALFLQAWEWRGALLVSLSVIAPESRYLQQKVRMSNQPRHKRLLRVDVLTVVVLGPCSQSSDLCDQRSLESPDRPLSLAVVCCALSCRYVVADTQRCCFQKVDEELFLV